MANEKKVALVTGSNRGIGFETARQLGQQGVRVLVTARTEREAADAASKLRSEGIEAEALALDVTNAADRAVAAEFVESRYGKLDILVNNAGVGPADGLIGLRASESTEDELQKHLQHQPVFLGSFDSRISSLAEEERCGQDRQPWQHPRLSDTSGNGREPHRATAEVRLQRLQGRGQRVHDSSGSGTQGDQHQGELRTSGLGENRTWLRRGADVCTRRSKDHCGGCTVGIG